MTINSIAEKVANLIRAQEGVVSVTLSEPPEDVIKEIASKYEILTNLVTFTVEHVSSNNVRTIHDMILPESGYKKIDEDLINATWPNFLNTIPKWPDTGSKRLRFYDHDATIGIMLRGHSQMPIENPDNNLLALIRVIKEIPGIAEVFSYEIYDKQILEEIGEGAISLNCVYQGIPLEEVHDKLLDILYTTDNQNRQMIQFELSKAWIDNLENHQLIVNIVIDSLN
jgi:hypothetical protein